MLINYGNKKSINLMPGNLIKFIHVTGQQHHNSIFISARHLSFPREGITYITLLTPDGIIEDLNSNLIWKLEIIQ